MYDQDGESYHINLVSQVSEKEAVAAWFIKVSHKYAETNMELDHDLSGQKITATSSIRIPCVVNHKSISQDDELILYRDKPVASVPVVEQLQDVKRRKLSKTGP